MPFYRELRAKAPVATLMDMPGTHVLSRYDDVKFALQHPEIFSSDFEAIDIGQQRPLIPLQIDPPEHAKYRRVMDPHLAHRQIVPREERVRALVNELIDRFIDRGELRHARRVHRAPAVHGVPRAVRAPARPARHASSAWKDDIIRPQVRHPELAMDEAGMTAKRHETGRLIYDFFDEEIAEAPGVAGRRRDLPVRHGRWSTASA